MRSADAGAGAERNEATYLSSILPTHNALLDGLQLPRSKEYGVQIEKRLETGCEMRGRRVDLCDKDGTGKRDAGCVGNFEWRGKDRTMFEEGF